jgi:hypothetical protein
VRRLAAPLCAALFSAAVCAADEKPAACPPQGDATRTTLQRLNEKRARVEEPAEEDIDDTVTMEALVAPGDDRLRWQDGQAAELTGYVVEVRDGGMASSNCHSSDPADHDTILDISPNGNIFDNAHRMVAVITPQWRRLLAVDRVDWSTRAVRAKYLNQYVTIVGWLLFNSEATSRALNTAPLAGPDITRATAWEIHPVTSIESEGDVLPQQAFLTTDRKPEAPIPPAAP